GGDVGLNGGILAKGHGARLRFPAELTFCSTRIRLTGAQDLVAVESYWQGFHNFIFKRPIFCSAGVVLTVAGISGAAMSFPRGSIGQKPHSAPVPSSLNSTASTVEKAVIQLKRRLADYNIDGIRVSVAGGQLAVSGRVGRSSTSDWNSVLK